MRATRSLAALVVSSAFVLAVPVAAQASGGGGGGGGGGNPPPGSPAVTLSPASLAFPAELTGVTSPPQTVTVSDTGSAQLFINGLSVRGAALDYTVTGDHCSGLTIPAGGSCSVTLTFTPTADGTRSATLNVLDNAPDSPQAVTLTGTGDGTGNGPTPLTIATPGMPCTGGVCDPTGGSPQITGNFWAAPFTATGGTAPYTWSSAGPLPAGLTLTPAGLISGTLPAVAGTESFTLRVTDAAGATATQAFSLSVVPSPAPGPKSCQQGPGVKEQLAGPAIGGKTPGGQAQEDESNLTACGGFGILTVNVSNVSLASGTVLWVSFDSKPVGTITLNGGQGAMRSYNLGDFGASFDQVSIVTTPPPAVLGQQVVLSGSTFS
jgi:Putative Ig domain